MNTITELTIATAVVAFLLGVAFQIDHAQARSPVPVIHENGATAAANVNTV
jgi:hypothetical protein